MTSIGVGSLPKSPTGVTRPGFFVERKIRRIKKLFLKSAASFFFIANVEPNRIDNELAVRVPRTLVDDHYRPAGL